MFKNRIVFFCLALTLGFVVAFVALSPEKNFAGLLFPKVFASSGTMKSGCTWGVTGTLPSSNTYNTDGIPWAIDFYNPTQTATYTSEASNFLDVNGDGMTDYVYAFDNNYTSTIQERCVYLNNGNGWDLAYYCKYNSAADPKFLGDCADTSS